MARISPGQMLSPPLPPRLPEPRAVRVRISPKLSLHQVLGGQPHLWEPKILGESLGPTCCSSPPPWSGVTQTPIQGRPGHPCTLCPGLSPFTGRYLPVCAGTRDRGCGSGLAAAQFPAQGRRAPVSRARQHRSGWPDGAAGGAAFPTRHVVGTQQAEGSQRANEQRPKSGAPVSGRGQRETHPMAF